MNNINRKFLIALSIALGILWQFFTSTGCVSTKEKLASQLKTELNSNMQGPNSIKKRAIQLKNNGEIETALQLLDDGIKNYPDNSKLKRTMSVLLLQSGRSEEAERFVLDLIKSNPNESGLHLLLGYILKSNKKNSNAMREFQTVFHNSSNRNQQISAHLGLAALYEELHIEHKANEHYQSALSLDASLWSILKKIQVERLRVKPALSDEYQRIQAISAAERERHFRTKISKIIDDR